MPGTAGSEISPLTTDRVMNLSFSDLSGELCWIGGPERQILHKTLLHNRCGCCGRELGNRPRIGALK